MKNASKLFTIICLLSLFFQGCSLNLKRGNGTIEIEQFNVENFNRLNVGGNYDVVLIKSEETRVVIETDENLIPFINVEFFEQTLSINNVHNLKSTEGIFIEVYYSDLNKIFSTGASSIENESVLINEELTINLSGAGSIYFEIQTSKVHVNLTGAGIINLSGETDVQKTHISGAGGLMAMELKSLECNINLSGLGGAEVFATERLEASISGIGGIVYAGNPKFIEKQVTGLGKIKRAEEYIFSEDL